MNGLQKKAILADLPTASSPPCPQALTFHWTAQCSHRNPGPLWSRSAGQRDSHPHRSCAAGWVWCSPWRGSPARPQSLASILCISHTCRAEKSFGLSFPHSQLSCYAPTVRTGSQIPGILSPRQPQEGEIPLITKSWCVSSHFPKKIGKFNLVQKCCRSP